MSETVTDRDQPETTEAEDCAHHPGPCGRHGWHHHHHHRGWHRPDYSQMSGGQRLLHRSGRVLGGLVFLAVKVTILALLVAVTVSAWRWIFEVLG